MKELIKGNLKVIEIKEGHIYECKKITKNGIYRTTGKFNAKNLEDAMQYAEKTRK